MNGGPLPGFHNAPVSKSFVIASAILTALFINRNPPINLGLSYQDIFEKFHLWKLIASVFAFSTTPELMFGLSLLYYFRVFERQIGSNKHTIFILFSVVVSLLFEVLAIIFLKDPSSTLASGPYGLIFASFIPFYFDIPVLSRFRLFGIQLSNKSFGYLSGFQLLFHCRKRSLLPGLCGVLAGILYRLNAFGIQKIKIPDVVSSFTLRFSWLLNSSSHAPISGSTTRAMPSFTGHQVEVQGNNPSTVRAAAVPEPSEASVATLVSMGFDINSARQALVHAGNDVNMATNILLESQSL